MKGQEMFFALDKQNKRVNAEDGIFSECVCPACGKPVKQRRGDINRHHFAHLKKESSCPYEYNKDYINMSEWHIRMQEYFPKDSREIIFTDKDTGEKHIADVFLKASNTVLEFQYSSIKKKEFFDRTNFHMKEGRRIVWLFYEGWKNEESKEFNNYGKLKHTWKNKNAEGPYSKKSYIWLYRKKYIEEGPDVKQPNYSVSVYTDTEGDVFHKIIDINEDNIILSLHDITMSTGLDIEEFFYPEQHWKEQEPWRSEFEKYEREEKSKKQFRIFSAINTKDNSKPQTKIQDPIEDSDEYKKRYLEYEDISIRIEKKNKEIQEKKEYLENQKKEKHKERCPKCGGKLVLRYGKYGKFYGCSNYPKCLFTYSLGQE